MQKFLYTLCFCLSAIYASCQITGFGYQGAARDVSGHVIASTQVNLRFSLLEGSVAGAELYVETQSTMTNQQGVFTLTVGNGVDVSGNFNSINWASSKFLKVEISIAGAAYIVAGTTQILSAPTAYYAQKAKQLDTSTNIDVSNKNVVNMANPIAAQDATTKNYVDAQIAADNALDNDKSATNEIQNLDNVLTISNSAGSKKITNLLDPTGTQDAATKNYVDVQIALDNDKSATNEIQNLDNVLTVSNSAGNKKITNLLDPTVAQDAATKNYVDTQIASDNVLDNDKSATNEIQDLVLVGSALRITNNPAFTQINLAQFLGTNTDNQNLDNVLAFGNSAGSQKITNLLDPTLAQDAATKNYVDAQITADNALDNDKSATNEIQNLDAVLTVNNSAASKRITNLLDPTVAQDAATKNYVDSQIAADNALDNDKSATNEIQNLDAVLTVNNSAGSKRIINLSDPSSSQDAATKNYVDTQGALGWIHSGNTITDPATQFIGTINSQPITFRSNNIERMRLSSSGNLGIGTNNPLQLLHVKPNNTPSDIVFDVDILDSFAEISLGTTVEANANNASNGNGGFASVITSGGNSPQYGMIGVSKGANINNSTGILAAASGSTSINRALYGRAAGASAASDSYGIQTFAYGTNDRTYGGYLVANAVSTTHNVGLFADAIGVSTFNYGVWGRAMNSTGVNAAGFFRKEGTAGTDNYGVSAIATAGLTGLTRGGYFEVLDNNGSGAATGVLANVSGTGTGANNGVFATVSGGSGTNRGGLFQKIGTTGTNNYGVAGIAEAGLTGTTRGGYFEVEDNNGTGTGYGIYATINGTGTGTNYGGYFEKTGTSGADNYGIRGTATAGPSGVTRGGFFQVLANDGTGTAQGVTASAIGTGSGQNIGIYAETSGSTTINRAGYFYKSGTAGTQNYGIQVRAAAGLSGTTFGGDFSLENNNGTGTGYGLYTTINGTGSGQNFGIRSEASGGSVTYGGYFNATGSSDNRGIHAEASGGTTNIAGEFIGDVTISQRATIGTVMRLTPLLTPPASPVKGEIYYDDNDNTIKYYNGTGWVTM